MKRWRKISLTSLVIPTVGGIGLISAGCGNTEIPTNKTKNTIVSSVNTPILQEETRIIGQQLNVKLWWDNFKKNVAKQVKALNTLFTEETKLNVKSISSIIPYFDRNSFKPEIRLGLGYAFKNGSRVWKSEQAIPYFCEIPMPVLSDELSVPTVIKTHPTIDDWWKTFETVEKRVNQANKWLTSATQLPIEAVMDIKIHMLEKRQAFTFKVILKDGFVFSNGKQMWTLPTEEPLSYSTEINEPVFLSNQPAIYTKKPTAKAWWESIAKDLTKQVEVLNALFTKETQLNAKLVEQITPQFDKEFVTFSVQLNSEYCFPGCINTWNSKQKVICINEIKTPVLTERINEVKIFKTQANIQEWWETFGSIELRVGQVNKWLTPQTQLVPNVVEDIKIVDLPDIQKFTLRIFLKKAYAFNDGSNVWTSPTNNSIAYMHEIKQPVFLLDQPTIYTKHINAEAWWNSFGDDLTKQVNALNELFTKETELKVNFVESITTKYHHNFFEFDVHLKQGYVFPDKLDTWSSDKKIKCINEIKNPILLDHCSITKTQANINDWWGSFDNIETKISKANKWLTAETQLPSDVVEAITVNDLETRKAFTFTITLKEEYRFNNGKRTWTSPVDNPIKYITQIKNPIFEKGKPHVFANALTAKIWWNEIGDNLTKQVDALNNLFTKATQLNANFVSQVVPKYNELSFIIEITLKDGYIFENSTANWSNDVPINYVHNVVDPVLSQDIETQVITKTQLTIEKWWETFTTLEAQINQVNKWLTFKTRLTPDVVEKIRVSGINHFNGFTFTIILKEGNRFSDNKNTWSSPSEKSIKYMTEIMQPVFLLNQPTISHREKSINQWWARFGKDDKKKVQALNKMLTPETQLNTNVVDYVSAKEENGRLIIEVHLTYGCIFPDGKNTWISQSIGYIQIVPKPILSDNLEIPKLDKPELTIDKWWDQLETIENKVKQVNKWFTLQTQLQANVVRDIKIFPISDRKALKFTIFLNDAYVFSDNKGVWSLPEQHAITYDNLVNEPVFSVKKPIISDSEMSAKDWWEKIGNDLEKQVDALNTLLTDKTKLNAKWVELIEPEYSLNDPMHLFKLNVRLAKGYWFRENYITWVSEQPINYLHQVEIPIISNQLKSPAFTKTQLDIKDWWETFPTVEAKINKINEWLTTETQLKHDIVAVAAIGDWKKENLYGIKEKTNQIFIQIVLKDGNVFTDGGNTFYSTRDCPIGYGTKIKKPVFTSTKPIIVAPYANIAEWKGVSWNSIDGQVKMLEPLFSEEEKLISETLSKLEILDNAQSFTLKATLKPGYIFEDGTNVWSSERSIAYITAVKVPVLTKNTIKNCGLNKTANACWNALQGDLYQQVNWLNTIITAGTKLNWNTVRSIHYLPISSHTFQVKVQLIPNHVFENNETIWESKAINYIGAVQFPIFQSNDEIYSVYDTKVNVDAWWNSFDTIAAKVQQINKWCDQEECIEPNVVADIVLNKLADGRSFTFTMKLKKDYVFVNDQPTWTSPSDKPFKYYTKVLRPKFASTNLVIHGKQKNFNEWNESIKNDFDKRVEAFNAIVTNDTQLDKQVIEDIQFEQTKNLNEIKVNINLKKDCLFDNNFLHWSSELYQLHILYQQSPNES